ncbi:MAG TPA: LacI family DNA-binding transcriptional regulator [Povalibacter sp.]|uniref:LacI family DNA-binding transcriptional regulator n=1 Tax=Povalibacter sp. TaxID=1962978 RepID=UPI002C8F9112|nr:LacI family DNA-binding transcriptional regulator [Povalibacter sp.]HMN46619.1 LacI family DNA-binding transcriptional regulator [Povalibacter sp.]
MATATIRDVAAQARVSIKTVSRVINNVKTVQPETRERVLRVIRKLDYHPNPSARGMGGKRSYLIGVLYDNSCAYYATGVLAGVLETCRAARYQVVLHPCDYQSPGLVDDVMRNVRQSRADGVIVTPPLSDIGVILAALKEHSVPFVRIAPAEHENDLHSVYTNDRDSSARMTEQLALLGHRRIGFIIGNPDHAAVADRYSGYRDGLKASGLALDKKLIVQGYNSFASGVEAGRKLLNLPADRRPTAIFASNDEMAAGVLSVAHGMGLAVPEDLSVAGFDDAPLASQVWPALTTIKQPVPAMSAHAAELLLKMLRGEPDERSGQIMESSLTFRQSTGPAPDRPMSERVRSTRAARIREGETS